MCNAVIQIFFPVLVIKLLVVPKFPWFTSLLILQDTSSHSCYKQGKNFFLLFLLTDLNGIEVKKIF